MSCKFWDVSLVDLKSCGLSLSESDVLILSSSL